MKKSLIALAAMVATGAFAQSSVTLYGIANIGIQKQTGTAVTLAGGADGNDSRIGFRGVEDLGGGLRALFVFEAGFNAATGQFDNAQPAGTATRLFQRQSYAGIGGNFGTVTLGRQNTISGKGSFWYMPNYYSNAAVVAGLGYGGVLPSRSDGAIQYTSPNFSGFGFKLGTQLKGNEASTLAGSAQGLTEAAVSYSNGPIQGNFTYASRRGTSGGGKAMSINAGYDFGMVTAFAAYNDVLGTNTGKGYVLGLNGNVGAFKPFVHYATNTQLSKKGIDLGTYYALSKRTDLYAMAGRANAFGSPAVTRFATGLSHKF